MVKVNKVGLDSRVSELIKYESREYWIWKFEELVRDGKEYLGVLMKRGNPDRVEEMIELIEWDMLTLKALKGGSLDE